MWILHGNRGSKLPVTSRLTPSSTARILEGVRLYEQLPDGQIITTGGSWIQAAREEQTCMLMKDLAVLLGVEESRIETACETRDTYEEAKKIQNLLDTEPFILVTSAYHMHRAVTIFKKMGMDPIPAPCDFKAQDHARLYFFDFIPNAGALLASAQTVNEYLGLAAYLLY